MSSKSVQAREAALIEQNEVLNAQIAKAQEEAHNLSSVLSGRRPLSEPKTLAYDEVNSPDKMTQGYESARFTKQELLNNGLTPRMQQTSSSHSPTYRLCPEKPGAKRLQESKAIFLKPRTKAKTNLNQSNASKQDGMGIMHGLYGKKSNKSYIGMPPPEQPRPLGTGVEPFENFVTAEEKYHLGDDRTLLYQKAEIRVFEEELSKLQEEHKKAKTKYTAATMHLEKLTAECSSVSKQLQQLQTLLEKKKALQSAHELKQNMLDADLSTMEAQVDECRKHEKQLLQTANLSDVRLNRALEELATLKKELNNERSNTGGTSVPSMVHEKALFDLKRLEKQKAELIAAFKKQIQLIDILKRQKIHLESAKMLSFIEDAIGRTLEIGP